MKLNELRPTEGSNKSKKRVGRGPGSGLGKTSGRGHKGQKSRSGSKSTRGFEGGQMPLQRRLPKFGFTNIFKKEYAIINIGDLAAFESGTVVDVDLLCTSGLVKKISNGVKVLGNGEIKQSLTLKVDKVTSGAKQKIEAAGGKVETE